MQKLSYFQASNRHFIELANFISRRRLQGTTQLLKDDHKRRYRFTSSVTKQVNGQIEHISQLHTLVRFAVELDEHNESARQAEPVVASVRQDKLPIQCAGVYVIGIRSWLANTAGDRANSIARIAYVGALLDKSKLISPEDAEAMTGTAAEYGYLLPNFAHDERLPAAVTLLQKFILPELDRLFKEFVERTMADIEDRATIRKQALLRHYDTKKANLNDQKAKFLDEAERCKISDNERRSQQLTALASATDGRLRRLSENVKVRLRQIEEQRQITPEWSDVAYLLIEVTP